MVFNDAVFQFFVRSKLLTFKLAVKWMLPKAEIKIMAAQACTFELWKCLISHNQEMGKCFRVIKTCPEASPGLIMPAGSGCNLHLRRAYEGFDILGLLTFFFFF